MSCDPELPASRGPFPRLIRPKRNPDISFFAHPPPPRARPSKHSAIEQIGSFANYKNRKSNGNIATQYRLPSTNPREYGGGSWKTIRDRRRA